jgi:mycothiol synthase
LTTAGLNWLAEAGITVGMLYVDGDNVAAVGLYRSMGFTVDHVDRAYGGKVAPTS